MEKRMQGLIDKANILIEALPYIQRLSGKTIVVKYGGNAMINEELTKTILQDLTLLKVIGLNPIVVHGGGPDINSYCSKMGIESKFHNGLRITDMQTMEAAQMVLVGKINKDIVSKINSIGGRAIGLCGIDGNLIEVIRKQPVDGVDLGYVGQIKAVNTKLLNLLSNDEYIPVIAPIGIGDDGQSYNINADTVAGMIAAEMRAEKLMFLTDIDGIRMDSKNPDTLIPVIEIDKVYELISNGVIDGGMIPKVKACVNGILQGVNRTHILDGTIPHPLLLEIFTHKGIGTMVVKNGDKDYDL